MHDDTAAADKPISSAPTFAPITVRVEYTLENPKTGLIFVDPDELVAPYVKLYIPFFSVVLLIFDKVHNSSIGIYVYTHKKSNCLALSSFVYHKSTAAWCNAFLVTMY